MYIYIYMNTHTYAHLYHLIIMKHYLFLHIEKNLSVKHLFRLILKQPKHTHTHARTWISSDSKWKTQNIRVSSLMVMNRLSWWLCVFLSHPAILSVFSLETSSLSLCHDELILWIFILNYCLWCIFPSWIR